MTLNREDTYTTFMLDHAAGAHTAAMMLAGDVHRLLSPKGRDMAQLWDIVGGALLETEALETALPAAQPRRREPSLETAESVLALSETPLKWKRGISGVHYFKTNTPRAKLMKLEAGKSAPTHGHSALEATIVLQGRFTDGHGVYERGDLVLGEPGLRHKPAAYGEEACVCFVAESPKKFWRFI